ncbi:hypothetical protein LVJ82_02740 [Vitreoscilla massiliensis]|uniref:Uncharacterized protein n=1 Tax=Vitreoscilla massiliensis TaxID=1689272 RepID=A0ABY4E927_9NEIS|nr:hypothetical protein [Vitreoscilla massiliensis]UOO89922.1 hypothetical protein LVJ82_02740 [Vitreoscilla massiliensis]
MWLWLKILGLVVLNGLALWGLAWVMFRDVDDFIDSVEGIFASEHTYFVPTRALWYAVLALSLLASEYHVLF